MTYSGSQITASSTTWAVPDKYLMISATYQDTLLMCKTLISLRISVILPR